MKIQQIVQNKVKLDCRSAYIEGAKQFTHDLRQLAGCRNASVLEDTTDQQNVVILSEWSDEKSMQADCVMQTFLKHKPDLKPYFISNTTLVFKEVG